MHEIKGAEAVISVLENLGVEVVFGYPGGANLTLYDALSQSKILHVLSRNEQGAGFMACGYGRVLNKPGVCLVTSGPGVTNLVTALADAYLDSTPLLAITGQIPRSFVGSDAFQEVDGINITIPITKHNELVYNSSDLVPAVNLAYYIANSGRKGPTLVDIPRDIQDEKNVYDLTKLHATPGYKPTLRPHIGQIKRCIKAIKRSKQPLVIAGGGVHLACAQSLLLEFLEVTGISMVRTLMGKALVPESHSQYIGMIGTHGNESANRAVNQADLIIVIGSRLGDRSTMHKKEYFADQASLVHIDIDPAEISKNSPSSVPIVSDIHQALTMLLTELDNIDFKPKSSWFKAKNNNNMLWKSDGSEAMAYVFQELSKIDKSLHITTDVGRHQMWATHFMSNSKHWPILTSGGLGTMGYGLPAAIGAWFADSSKSVVNITGDGSFYMNMQEFLTAVDYKIPLTVLVINDSKLGMIKELQSTRYGGRYFGHDFLSAPDFSQLAKAMGGTGLLINKYSDVLPKLTEAIDLKSPVIIDFDLHSVAKSLVS